MNRIQFVHGGVQYDAAYPEGIPTTIMADFDNNDHFESDMIMFPGGHAKCERRCTVSVLLLCRDWRIATHRPPWSSFFRPTAGTRTCCWIRFWSTSTASLPLA